MSKKSTIHDIAAALNITASTVSRALNDHPRISEKTKKAVLKKARDINYQPNKVASALRSGKSQLIGVIMPNIDRSFFASVVRGVEEVVNTLNYQVVVSSSYERVDNEVKAVNAMLNAQIDGVIVSLGKNTENFEHYQKLLEKKIPLVLFDRTTPKIATSQVVIDDFQGAYMATEHLIKQGCKQIVHLTNYNIVNIYKERFRGYQEALKDHNIPFKEELVRAGDMQLADGRNAVTELVQGEVEFDGIFSASDLAATGALQVLKEYGKSVPQDVAIVGFSNEPFTSFTDPPLSTVDQFPIEMGKTAANLFFEMMNSYEEFVPKKNVLNPRLIIRESSLRKQ